MKPAVGPWYTDCLSEAAFEVLAIDEELIEVQYEDGAIEEMDLADWHEEVGLGNIVRCEKPWSDGFVS